MAVVLHQNQFYRIGSCWQNKFSMSPKSNLGVFCVVFSFFLATNDQMLFFPHTLFTGNLFQLNVFIFCFGFGVSNCGKLIGCAGAGGGGAPLPPGGGGGGGGPPAFPGGGGGGGGAPVENINNLTNVYQHEFCNGHFPYKNVLSKPFIKVNFDSNLWVPLYSKISNNNHFCQTLVLAAQLAA